uniref:Uncharacterized protein n=1 Tax=Salix viminalis TaxID=40686 RepID=A0A6N2KWF5_SALVM
MQLSSATCSHSGNQSQTLMFARTDCAENILLNTTWIPILLDYTSDDHRMVGPLTNLSVFISVSLHHKHHGDDGPLYRRCQLVGLWQLRF